MVLCRVLHGLLNAWGIVCWLLADFKLVFVRSDWDLIITLQVLGKGGWNTVRHPCLDKQFLCAVKLICNVVTSWELSCFFSLFVHSFISLYLPLFVFQSFTEGKMVQLMLAKFFETVVMHVGVELYEPKLQKLEEHLELDAPEDVEKPELWAEFIYAVTLKINRGSFCDRKEGECEFQKRRHELQNGEIIRHRRKWNRWSIRATEGAWENKLES